VTILALCWVQVTATSAGNRGVRLIATQQIRADAVDTLRPAAVSHDGRLIAFVTRLRQSSSCCQNVFVLDRSTGRITQESIGADGAPLNGDSGAPSLSSDGGVIAFETVATNLLPGTSGTVKRRVVVRHRESGAVRTPEGWTGNEPDGESSDPAVSGDGRTIVFVSDATNLVKGSDDANGRQTDIYLWRLDDSSVIRVSVDTTGVHLATGTSHSAVVNRDGDVVAFVSTARLVPEDSNNVTDVFIRDVRNSATFLVSREVGGRAPERPSHSPAISADGRYVAFVSIAQTLGPRDRNQDSDVYVYDVQSRSTTLISATAKGHAANAGSRRPAISANGRFVVYQTVASNVGAGPGCPQVPPDPNLLEDVYLFDRVTGCSARISGSPDREWWTPSVAPAIDSSGSLVTFSSTQPLGDDDPSTDFDLFLFERSISDRHFPASRCCQ
jgi:Tol biopolymer transport system component